MTDNNPEKNERSDRRGRPNGRSGFAGHDRAGTGPHEWPDRGFGGRGPGGFGAFRDPFGWPGGRERLFDAGDFKLVILSLLSEQPGYGYQLIKTLEQRLAGGYTPSAGVIYPTLTMLEEEGFAAVSTDSGRKVYAITPEGEKFLKENADRTRELFDRLESAGRGFQRGRSPEIMMAFGNLTRVVIARTRREDVTEEEIRKITDVINGAAREIDEI